MPRGKKIAVSRSERRRWLDRLESGKGITEIARAAGRDIRIVKEHIEIAREEKQSAEVKREFLLGVLKQHQEGLLAEVGRLRHVVSVYPPSSVIPGDTIKRKIHEALRQHLKRSPLIGLLESYESAVEENNKEGEYIRNQLRKKEDEILAELPAGVVTHPWTRTILDDLETGLLKDETPGVIYNQDKQSDGDFEVRYGTFNLTRSNIPETHQKAVIDAHKKFISSARTYSDRFDKHRRLLKEIASAINDELDVLTIRRSVPGSCSYCPV